MVRRLCVVILAGFAAAALPAVAVSDDTCISCHSEESALSDAGARAASMVVTAASLEGSPHEGFSCTQCHADLAPDDAAIPHAKKLAPADCASCHGDLSESMKGSIHTDVFQEQDGVKSTCVTCHGSHAIRRASETTSPTNPRHVADTCARCHEVSKDGKDPVSQWKTSVHGQAVLQWDVHDAPSCSACHKPHKIRAISDPEEPLHRKNQMNVCGSCHPSELKVVLRGEHGKAWAAGNEFAPVCTSCHGEHDMQRPRERDSHVYAAQMTETCGKCHGSAEVTQKAGLPADRVSTYYDSFHGKAMRWKNENVANCASCHRYHDVRKEADPASPIHDQNIQLTCGQVGCHPGASLTFAKLPVHTMKESPYASLLKWIEWTYIGLIVGTLGFMGVHQVLDLGALLRARRRHRKGAPHHVHSVIASAQASLPPQREPLTKFVQQDGKWVIQRWTMGQVLQHFLLASTFLTLCLTGFLLELPASWAQRLGSWGGDLFELRSLLHRIAAVLMTVTSVYHLYWLLFNRRGRRELAAMLPRPIEDGRHMLENFQYFLGLRKEPAAGRRYTYREKMEYWALIWGTIVMVFTGIVLWSASHWHWMVVEISSIVHSYEAILAFGAILIWHFLSVQFRPGFMHRINPTVVDGTVYPHVMHEEHPAEYREVVAWHGFDPFKDEGGHGHGGPGGGPRDGKPVGAADKKDGKP